MVNVYYDHTLIPCHKAVIMEWNMEWNGTSNEIKHKIQQSQVLCKWYSHETLLNNLYVNTITIIIRINSHTTITL